MMRSDKAWIKTMEWCAKYWGCHQIPERSFFVFGYQMPICARCFGLMIGEMLGAICAFVINLPTYICLLLMMPMAVDGIVQYKTEYVSTNIRRFITGALFGFCFIYLIVHFVYRIFI